MRRTTVQATGGRDRMCHGTPHESQVRRYPGVHLKRPAGLAPWAHPSRTTPVYSAALRAPSARTPNTLTYPSSMTTPITRFAPSPTGHLHIGGARTALFCAAYAHGRAGRFVLRIEDTDQKRSSDAAARGILEDLAWLGICWDDGPPFNACGGDPRSVGSFYQSERLAIYNAAFEKLLATGDAYPCFETADELTDMRKAAEARKETFTYRQRPDYNHAQALARAAHEEHVLRFKMPPRPVTVKDEILGEVVFPYEELDDLVIRKRDTFPTYHFAVVVDDEAMGVTHVIRGQEHLNNTPRHIALIHALGYRLPVFAHLPLIFNPDGSKMSKRDRDKTLRKWFKGSDILPDPSLKLLAEAEPTVEKWIKSSQLAEKTRQARLSIVRPVIKSYFDLHIEEFVGHSAEEIVASCFSAIGQQSILVYRSHVRSLLHFLRELIDVKFQQWYNNTSEQLNSEIVDTLASDIELNLPEVEVEHFRMRGYLPEAIINYIALLGWNPGTFDDQGRNVERFDRAFLDATFSFDRVGKAASKFDREKLRAFNSDLIKSLPPADFAAAWRAWAERYDHELTARLTPEQMLMLAPAIQPRTVTLSEARQPIAFLFADADALIYDEKAVAKFMHKGEPVGTDALRDFTPSLAALSPFTPEAIEALLADHCEREGLKMGTLAQPIRIALTGAAVSPPLGITLAALGKDESLRRIERCLGVVGV